MTCDPGFDRTDVITFGLLGGMLCYCALYAVVVVAGA